MHCFHGSAWILGRVLGNDTVFVNNALSGNRVIFTRLAVSNLIRFALLSPRTVSSSSVETAPILETGRKNTDCRQKWTLSSSTALAPATAACESGGLTYGGKVDLACAGILARLAAILALLRAQPAGETAELAFAEFLRLTIRDDRSHHCRVAFCVVRRRVSLQSHRTR
jgi:hypothetical protein